ncbi:MAG TPA: hypothetical protein VMB21_15120 [Candidatus Limnocylindria bacterium]|jgi:hypothetical protein|nr:hypothetical protein [Candidatus Limnocylindria bacterium]
MEALKQLTPLAAIQTWLDGEFGVDEEPALCFAIRKDARITLSDDEIIDVICDALEQDWPAAECLEALAEA